MESKARFHTDHHNHVAQAQFCDLTLIGSTSFDLLFEASLDRFTDYYQPSDDYLRGGHYIDCQSSQTDHLHHIAAVAYDGTTVIPHLITVPVA